MEDWIEQTWDWKSRIQVWTSVRTSHYICNVAICIFEHICLCKCASHSLVFIPIRANTGFERLLHSNL